MLVLGRNQFESIIVICPNGDRIVITVVSQTPNAQVRIGVEAAPEYRVLREELEQKGVKP